MVFNNTISGSQWARNSQRIHDHSQDVIRCVQNNYQAKILLHALRGTDCTDHAPHLSEMNSIGRPICRKKHRCDLDLQNLQPYT